MGVVRTYLSAVAAGALTAGVAAASVVAVPPDTAVSPQPTARDVNLAADPIEIKIIDIGPTPGPLSIWRQLYVLAGLDPLTAGLRQQAGNTYNLPGLDTKVDSNTKWLVQAVRESDSIDFGAASEQGQLGSWELLGGLVASSAEVTGARNLHFKPLLGGTEGIGAALYGTLSGPPADDPTSDDPPDPSYHRTLEFFDSKFDRVGNRTVGDFNGELALLPWDGFKVVGRGTADPTPGELPPPATLINTDRETTFNLGSLEGDAASTVTLDGGAGLCLGSAKPSCGGNTAFLEVGAPVTGHLTVAGRNIVSGNFASNRLVAELGNGQFSVTGAVGGSFSIGSLEIGRPIEIDFQIPRASSTMLAGNNRQGTFRDSLRAIPQNSGSDNETVGRHRAGPLREAVADIKKAVNDAVSGKHAAKESED